MLLIFVCVLLYSVVIFFFSSKRRHTRLRISDWSSYVCSSDLARVRAHGDRHWLGRRGPKAARHGGDRRAHLGDASYAVRAADTLRPIRSARRGGCTERRFRAANLIVSRVGGRYVRPPTPRFRSGTALVRERTPLSQIEALEVIPHSRIVWQHPGQRSEGHTSEL